MSSSAILDGHVPQAASRRAQGSVGRLMRLFWLEFRRSQGYWLLPIVVAFGLYIPPVEYWPDLVRWRDMNVAAAQGFVLAGACAAAMTTWLIGRSDRRHTGDLETVLPTSRLARELLLGAVGCGWGAIGYALVVGWFWGQGFLRATWGGPDWSLVGLGLTGVVAGVSIGLIVGQLVAARLAPLLSFVLVMAITTGSIGWATTRIDGSNQPPLRFLTPWGAIDLVPSSVFVTRERPMVAESFGWMLAAIAVLLASAIILRLRTVWTWTVLAVTVGVAIVALVPLVPANVRWGPEAERQVAYEPVCERTDVVEVCLHPAYVMDLEETTAQLSTIVTPIRGLDGIPEYWEQVPHSWRENPGDPPGTLTEEIRYMAPMAVADAIFPIEAYGPYGIQRPASQIVILHWLLVSADLAEPMELGTGIGGTMLEVPQIVLPDPSLEGAYVVQPDETAYLQIRGDMQAAYDRFVALSPAEQRAWLEANWTALRAGDLTLDDLP